MIKPWGIIGLALAHLVLVAMGAANVEANRWGRVGKVLSAYGSLTGAGDSYGFFAPGIEGQLQARFEWRDPQGEIHPAFLVPEDVEVNRESTLRYGNIIDQMQSPHSLGTRESEDPMKFQRLMVASLAGAIMGRHPEATQVKVYLDRFEPASTSEFRNGKRPKWEQIYEAEFSSNSN